MWMIYFVYSDVFFMICKTQYVMTVVALDGYHLITPYVKFYIKTANNSVN